METLFVAAEALFFAAAVLFVAVEAFIFYFFVSTEPSFLRIEVASKIGVETNSIWIWIWIWPIAICLYSKWISRSDV